MEGKISHSIVSRRYSTELFQGKYANADHSDTYLDNTIATFKEGNTELNCLQENAVSTVIDDQVHH
jgi:hypothetical protein